MIDSPGRVLAAKNANRVVSGKSFFKCHNTDIAWFELVANAKSDGAKLATYNQCRIAMQVLDESGKLDEEWISQAVSRLQDWHSPSIFSGLVQEFMQQVPNVTLFNSPKAKPLREAWVLSEFARLHGAISLVRLVEDDPPDCEATLETNAILGLEIVEVLKADRRRGKEYREETNLNSEPVSVWRENANATIPSVRSTIQSKVSKYHNPSWSLLVYLNPGGTYGLGREETKAALPGALQDAVDCFGSVWVLWDGELLRYPGG